MTEFNSWIQNNWYSLGNLLVEFAFLFAGVWFARKILKTMRASQEQFGTLLKLSLSDGLNERSKAAATTHRESPYVLAEWPAPEAPALSLPEPEPQRKRLAAGWRHLMAWLQTPMGSEGSGSWRKIVHWLQAPAGN